MIVGVRGSGVRTQLELLYNKYQIPSIGLKENLLQYLSNEKQKRINARRLRRGFKAPEPQTGDEAPDPATLPRDEEGNIVDAELLQEDDTYDAKKVELDAINYIFKDVDSIFVNGNFFEVEEKVTTPLVELLKENKKLPEAIIFMKVDENSYLKRVFNK
jgi:adenylate/nucleoside-diphosphate kinase